MADLIYNPDRQLFYWLGEFETRDVPERFGFKWMDGFHIWATQDAYKALAMAFSGKVKVDQTARMALSLLARRVMASRATQPAGSPPPAPDGLQYFPYQAAGIEYAKDLPFAYIADEPGLGKTIQAIGIANAKGYRRLLVACPALLRLNWQKEIRKWHMGGAPVEVILSGADLHLAYRTGVSVVASYELLSKLDSELFQLLGLHWDLFIADESHYLKNEDTGRSRVILGAAATRGKKGKPGKEAQYGFMHLAKQAVFLSGTPIENGPKEFHAQLFKACPHAIGNMNYWQYANTFCHVEQVVIGSGQKVVNGKKQRYLKKRRQVSGAKNMSELSVRLRSTVMVRRLKEQVLKDLPEKRYHMAVFPQSSTTSKVIRKEEPFDVHEILAAGGELNSPALPQIRKEMGIAKAPAVVEYLHNLLSSEDKVVVGVYHRDVVEILMDRLAPYYPALITGDTLPRAKEEAVERFQNDPSCRLFIGQIKAAGVGITLTKACNVVLAEPSWVPGVNSQFVDRCHRIGQTRGVLVHMLVVEGSLDARILSSAAHKQSSALDPILN